jgi:hypothetical protein
MMETVGSSETSDLTTVTQHNIPEGGILQDVFVIPWNTVPGRMHDTGMKLANWASTD